MTGSGILLSEAEAFLVEAEAEAFFPIRNRNRLKFVASSPLISRNNSIIETIIESWTTCID